MSTNNIKLLPCPFCGGRAEFYPDRPDKNGTYGVCCKECGGDMGRWLAGHQLAANAWNKRKNFKPNYSDSSRS